MTEMGLGKTFIGSEKAISLHKNILVVCQKSKVDDWINHFRDNYNVEVYNLTDKGLYKNYLCFNWMNFNVAVINYDLIWRRP